MADLVVCDSSVALAWLQEEHAPEWVRGLLDAAEVGEVDIRVPTLFWLEVGNTLGRRVNLSDEQAFEGVLRLEALGFVSVEMDRPLRLRSLELARRFSLTTYDGMYLALATALGAELATLDERLGLAASLVRCRYADDSHGGVAEMAEPYGDERPPDPVSLAALGAWLAELRTPVAPSEGSAVSTGRIG